VKLQSPALRILFRIVLIGILSVVVSLLVGGMCHRYESATSPTPTIGEAAVPILSPSPRSLGEVLEIEFGVNLLMPFGFLFGIWFLWTQGRNLRREGGRSALKVSRLRIGAIIVAATTCALPLSYYVMLVKSKVHSGLADTPAERMRSFILSLTTCAIALGGIAILGRFWPRANPDSPDTQS
jgi:hypothetical protein